MSYFPMFIELEGESCLVVGGGTVAYRKVCVLREFGANVTVVADIIDDEIKKYIGAERCIEAEIDRKSVRDAGSLKCQNVMTKKTLQIPVEAYKLVVAATDNQEINREIAQLCKRKSIPINAVDQLEDCSFIFPSYYKAGKLTLALTTSGSSPYYAAKLREKLQNEIPEMTEAFLEQMSEIRALVKERVEDSAKRGQILKKIVLFAMEEERILTQKEIEDFLENEA